MSRFEHELRDLPCSGGDLHGAINRAALAGLREGHPAEDVAEAVVSAAEGKGRSYGALYSEVWRTVRSAIKYLGRKDSVAEAIKAAPQRTDVDYAKIKDLVLGTNHHQVLVEASKPIPDVQEEVLRQLYPPDSWACFGWNLRQFETRKLEDWFGRLHGLQFAVPNPMRAKYGLRKDGGISQRCNDNVGRRRFQIVEFDFKPAKGPACVDLLRSVRSAGYTVEDLNLALHLHLQTFLPLAMAVHSGGCSIHGWYLCEGVPDSQLAGFHRYCMTLGADPALFTPSQFTRFPDGRRTDGRVQEVIYWNDEVLS